MVSCSVCSLSYDVSARTGRDIRAGRVEPRCQMHRRRRRTVRPNAKARRWWLERVPLDWIVETGHMIWPDLKTPGPSTSPAVMALAMSPRVVRRETEPTDAELRDIAAATQARRKAHSLS